jgi:hypothetical protein
MANKQISDKWGAIGKANAQVVGIVAAASFITIFCLFAAHSVWVQTRYQAKVTTAKEKAHSQLQKNVKAFSSLADSYQAFDSKSTNVIGGSSNGKGDNDGHNTKIVLDALPSAYDFPALTSSLEKILIDRNLHVTDITGIDDQLTQQGNSSSPSPQPVPMPFSFSVGNANYLSVQQLISALQQSIRPIQIDSINLAGGANNLTLTVKAHTYYQPAKSLNITKKVVK